MNAKFVWSFVIVVVVAVGAYYLLATYQPMGQPVAPATTPVQWAPGAVVNVTPTSITVGAAGGATQTFSIDSSTVVRSVVAAGEVGKSVAQLTAGTNVLIIPKQSDPNAAQIINVVPQPPVPAKGSVGFTGIVTAVSASGLSLKLADGSVKKITVTAQTELLSSVTAGQIGIPFDKISAGSSVQVLGTTAGGATTAQFVMVIN